MPLLKKVSRAEASDITHAHYDTVFGKGVDPTTHPGTSTGTPGDFHMIWSNTPELFKTFSTFDRKAFGKADPKLLPLASLRTGYLRRSQFVVSQQSKGARGAGIDEEKIKSISFWNIASCYSDVERAVLAFTDSIILEGGRTPKEVIERLQSFMPDSHILEIAHFIKTFDMHASLIVSFRMEYDDVPERAVEIPKPKTPRVQNHRDPKSWND